MGSLGNLGVHISDQIHLFQVDNHCCHFSTGQETHCAGDTHPCSALCYFARYLVDFFRECFRVIGLTSHSDQTMAVHLFYLSGGEFAAPVLTNFWNATRWDLPDLGCIEISSPVVVTDVIAAGR